MKITLEFNSLTDLLKELPRLSHVIETPPDSEGFIEIAAADEAEKDRKIRVGTAEPDAPEPGKPAQTKQTRAGAAAEAKPEKNTPKTEDASDTPPFDEVSVTDVRAALNALLKAHRRDAAMKILASFGATGVSGLKAANYAEVVEKAKAAKNMSDEEYEREYGS